MALALWIMRVEVGKCVVNGQHAVVAERLPPPDVDCTLAGFVICAGWTGPGLREMMVK